MQHQLAHDNRRDPRAEPTHGQSDQRSADDKQGERTAGGCQRIDGAGDRRGQCQAKHRHREPREQADDQRVVNQPGQRFAQRLPPAGAALFALRHEEQEGNHQQVFHRHVERERNARHRRQRQQEDGIADEPAVRTRHAHRIERAGGRIQPADAPAPGITQADHRPRSDAIGEQVADVENLANLALRQRAE